MATFDDNSEPGVDGTESKPSKAVKSDRAKRLAAALKENLRRRKARARARDRAEATKPRPAGPALPDPKR